MLYELPIDTPIIDKACLSAFHLYSIQLHDNKIRRRVFDKMRLAGVGVQVHYIPVYRQPYYQNIGFEVTDFPNAERFYSKAISLPIFPVMTDDQQKFVVDTLEAVLQF